ncbi:hypothetical protein [Bradyrhizobium sp. SZCCHNRI1029]|uniref:hypothetical protein n=1 Tax=Bradyrhizobium sp. SZCCHNRI1029 TaxID=3057278 RepID=UPI002915C4FE|nr:hypothetical protein [Bradyrhizobium sp. SZCCHNRI1029]
MNSKAASGFDIATAVSSEPCCSCQIIPRQTGDPLRLDSRQKRNQKDWMISVGGGGIRCTTRLE